MKHGNTYMELVKEWSPKNGKPLDTYPLNSSEKHLWVCEKGHEWVASILARSSGRGCPLCSGRRLIKGVNNAATLRPDLVAEWDSAKNGINSLSDYNPRSKALFWWKCSKGHEWKTSIYNRTAGCGCPYCTGKSTV